MGADTHGEENIKFSPNTKQSYEGKRFSTDANNCRGEWKNDCPYPFCKCAAKESTKFYSVTIELKPDTRVPEGYLFDFKGEKKFAPSSTVMFSVVDMMDAFKFINTNQVKGLHIKQIKQ